MIEMKGRDSARRDGAGFLEAWTRNDGSRKERVTVASGDQLTLTIPLPQLKGVEQRGIQAAQLFSNYGLVSWRLILLFCLTFEAW